MGTTEVRLQPGEFQVTVRPQQNDEIIGVIHVDQNRWMVHMLCDHSVSYAELKHVTIIVPLFSRMTQRLSVNSRWKQCSLLTRASRPFQEAYTKLQATIYMAICRQF